MNKLATTMIAAAGLSALAAAPAQAEDIRVPVGYADLDIGSDAGAAALASRIEADVAQACARSGDMRRLKTTSTCKQQLVANAVEQLNARGEALVAGKLAAQG